MNAAGGVARVVDTWCKLDHQSAFLAADHEVIEATRPLRALIASSLLEARDRAPIDRDLGHAFGAIGRAVAEGHGSPTLAAVTVDSLLLALGEPAAPTSGQRHAFASAARSAIFESFAFVTRATLHDDANRRWEYPACVVGLADGAVAIAAGHPVDDEEALVGWASRVAHALALSGVRRAVVSGSEKAVLAVLDALDLAGVAATQTHPGRKAEPTRPR